MNLKKILLKIQGRYFRVKMSIYGLLKLPAQTQKERQIFKAIFDLTPKNRKLKVFEWGSGYSTLYYAQYLREKNINFEWHAIDNNKSWYGIVKKLVKEKNLHSKINLYLKEFTPFWKRLGWSIVPPPCGKFIPSSENEKNYVNYPRQIKKKFDVIIVDARFRKRCIQVAQKVLQPDGIVILHDAQKKQYRDGLEVYPSQRFIDSGKWYPLQEEANQIWIGSTSNHPAFEKLKDF